MSSSIIVVNNIKLPINASHKEAFSVARAKLKKLGIGIQTGGMRIHKRSVDARNKSDIRFVYSVAAGFDGDTKSFGVISDTDISPRWKKRYAERQRIDASAALFSTPLL